MLSTHIKLLNEQAEDFFEQAKLSQKPKEKLALSERAQQLLAEARQILKDSQEQTTLFYFEFMLNIKKKFSFESYLEFSYRNNLKPLSKTDYDLMVKAIGK